MQELRVVWDDGSDGNVYRRVSEALKRGATVASISSASAEGQGHSNAVFVFVLEGTKEQLEG